MLDDIELAIAEIQQPRSRFQLERFVLGAHPTDEMRYYQTCLELQDMLFKYKNATLEIKKAEIEIARLRATGDEVDEVDAQIKELGLQQTRLAMIGAERELTHLAEIFHSFGRKYTRDEIEAAQPDYWAARLTTNANAMLAGSGGVNPAHLEAMDQAGVLEPWRAVKEAERKALEATDVRNVETELH
jgi:hypothetical protein